MPLISATRFRNLASESRDAKRTLGPGFISWVKQYSWSPSIHTAEAFIVRSKAEGFHPLGSVSFVLFVGTCSSALLFRKRTRREPTGCRGISSETPPRTAAAHDFG